ncbi:hypothetical protein [Glutamicibacter sp. FBE19]|uniref:hypothetical protein n=1 Tax=Glutamicibacter sp. FBE19 TaxID=2761534 RepID=UPI0018969D37|nr:hypothetical protein [Glutamicibacter sp. FBE19]MBF6673464.1 hypothetical protein [Glutamicibacter sp. FBE19]
MKRINYRLAVECFFLAAAPSVAACSSGGVTAADPGSLPVAEKHGSFAVDVEKPAATVGDADYVFVGKVESKVGTTYKDPVAIETENGTKEIADPYTDYKIKVLRNIKGELVSDRAIPVQKSGGVDKEQKYVVLYEDDVLPEVGSTYVFLAYAQEDGSLLVSGLNSSLEIETGTEMELGKSKVVQAYGEAMKNQEKTDRTRFRSNFDAS